MNYINRTHYVIIFTAKNNIHFHSISATEQLSPSSESNTLIPRVFCNSKTHRHVHKSMSLISVLRPTIYFTKYFWIQVLYYSAVDIKWNSGFLVVFPTPKWDWVYTTSHKRNYHHYRYTCTVYRWLRDQLAKNPKRRLQDTCTKPAIDYVLIQFSVSALKQRIHSRFSINLYYSHQLKR